VEINLSGIVIIVGNYGSGKTEVSVNLALMAKQAGTDVRIADLDLVNPYFRTREARNTLAGFGIDVVLPPEQYLYADLPILAPAVAGMIRNPSALTLLDVGGDDVGATVLAALSDVLSSLDVRVIQIINPFRPFTDTPEGCGKIRREIEAASRLKVNGLIGNAHLLDETTPEEIYSGYEFARRVSAQSDLPLEAITATSALLPDLDMDRFDCPVLPIRRQMVPPWKRAVTIGPGGLRI